MFIQMIFFSTEVNLFDHTIILTISAFRQYVYKITPMDGVDDGTIHLCARASADL